MRATATHRIAERTAPTIDPERGHRIRLRCLYFVAIVSNLAIFIYGFDYYKLPAHARPFSPKHHMLHPSSPIGPVLGFAGAALLFGIFLDPLPQALGMVASDREYPALARYPRTDGADRTVIITFHCTLKFKGIAGMTFWIMVAVSISGVVGRYLYAQIPRRVTTVELSMKELQALQKSLLQQLVTQRLLPEADLRALVRMSDAQQLAWLPIPIALIYMIVLDVVRNFGVARLRRHASGERFRTFFGFVPTRHPELEIAIRAAAEEAALSKAPALALAFEKALPRLARDSQTFQLRFCCTGRNAY